MERNLFLTDGRVYQMNERNNVNLNNHPIEQANVKISYADFDKISWFVAEWNVKNQEEIEKFNDYWLGLFLDNFVLPEGSEETGQVINLGEAKSYLTEYDYLAANPEKTKITRADFRQWIREENKKNPATPLTQKEEELLQKTLLEAGKSREDFMVEAVRQSLRDGSTLSKHDNRRPLPL